VNVSNYPSNFARTREETIATQMTSEDFVANLSADSRLFLFPAKPNRYHRVELAAKTSDSYNRIEPSGSCFMPSQGKKTFFVRSKSINLFNVWHSKNWREHTRFNPLPIC